MTGDHRAAYPLLVDRVWHRTCRCHWWEPIRDTRPDPVGIVWGPAKVESR